MLHALRRAKELFRDRRAWTALMRRGMERDFSWGRSAEAYEALYQRLAG
jgi:starch synthase